MQHILKLEEEFWAVKSRTKWTLLGDCNTKFFHLSTIRRWHHNKIWCLKDSAGNWTHSLNDIHDQILSHFTSLYTLEALYAHWNHIPPPHFPSIPESLLDLHGVSNIEIKEAIFSFKPLKAPDPNGFHPVFFQKYWNIVGRSITSFLKKIFKTHKISEDLNATLLYLIPKISKLETVHQFWPISLCNTLYKAITKIIVRCLRPHIIDLIHPFQASCIHCYWFHFVLGWMARIFRTGMQTDTIIPPVPPWVKFWPISECSSHFGLNTNFDRY